MVNDTYELLQDLDFGLEALPVSNLRAWDDLDGPLLPVFSVSSRTDLAISTLAQFLSNSKKVG